MLAERMASVLSVLQNALIVTAHLELIQLPTQR